MNARLGLSVDDLDEIVAGLTVAALVTEDQARDLAAGGEDVQPLVARAARFGRTKARVVRLRRAAKEEA